MKATLALCLAVLSALLVSCGTLAVSDDGFLMSKQENGVSVGVATDENGKVVAQRVEWENADGVKVRIEKANGAETVSFRDPSGVWVEWTEESGVSLHVPKAVPVEPTK